MKNVILIDGMEGKIQTVHGAVLCLAQLDIVALGCPISGDAGEFFDQDLRHMAAPGTYSLNYRDGVEAIAFVTMHGTICWFKNNGGESYHYAGNARAPLVTKGRGEEFRTIAEQWLATVLAGG